jgi:hypothetical protein
MFALFNTGALARLLECDLPVLIGLRLAKLRNAVQREYMPVETQRQRLVGKYGENGQVTEENEPAFMDELRELFGVESEFDTEPVPISVVADATLPGEATAVLVETGILTEE